MIGFNRCIDNSFKLQNQFEYIFGLKLEKKINSFLLVFNLINH
jgi:hypothetical protein